MKIKKIALVFLIVVLACNIFAQDPPSSYTTWYKLRMWDEGAYPTADSVNKNLIDLDLHLKNRDLRIDSIKSAYTWMFNFSNGYWKRYDATEFDNDSLKVKTGVFPKLTTANTFSALNTFVGGEIKFSQDFGTTLNFTYDNDLGGVFIKKNGSTTLLEFDEDEGLYWHSNYPFVIDGALDADIFQINGTPVHNLDSNKYFSVSRLDTSKLFYERDTTRLGALKRTQTWTGANTFSGITYTGTIETGNTTVTGNFDVTTGTTTISGDATVNADLTAGERFHMTQGSNIAISDTITLGVGNIFKITGTGNLYRIKTTGWQDGDIIVLLFSVNNNQVITIGSTSQDFPGCINARVDLLSDTYQAMQFVLINQRWYYLGPF